METLAYPELFALQDQVLSTVFSVETSFYLTGGTCLHRFHLCPVRLERQEDTQKQQDQSSGRAGPAL